MALLSGDIIQEKSATFENNFAQSSQLAEKNASFSFSSFAEN